MKIICKFAEVDGEHRVKCVQAQYLEPHLQVSRWLRDVDGYDLVYLVGCEWVCLMEDVVHLQVLAL